MYERTLPKHVTYINKSSQQSVMNIHSLQPAVPQDIAFHKFTQHNVFDLLLLIPWQYFIHFDDYFITVQS